MVLVSFITTTKNAQNYIEETIYSVLNQTFEDLEYVIVDDGSTDNTLKIIKDISLTDPRIKLIETDGIGRGKALNLAIKNVQGDYIANIDADDPAHPKRAEIQVKMMKKNTHYSVLATDTHFIGKENKVTWDKINISVNNVLIHNATITKASPFSNKTFNHSSVMFRKKDLFDVGLYSEERQSQFDYELWIRMSLMGFQLGIIPLKLSTKRIHDKQSFEIGNRRNYLKGSLELNLKVIKELDLPISYNIYVYLRYLYGFLPKKLRTVITKLK